MTVNCLEILCRVTLFVKPQAHLKRYKALCSSLSGNRSICVRSLGEMFSGICQSTCHDRQTTLTPGVSYACAIAKNSLS